MFHKYTVKIFTVYHPFCSLKGNSSICQKRCWPLYLFYCNYWYYDNIYSPTLLRIFRKYRRAMLIGARRASLPQLSKKLVFEGVFRQTTKQNLDVANLHTTLMEISFISILSERRQRYNCMSWNMFNKSSKLKDITRCLSPRTTYSSHFWSDAPWVKLTNLLRLGLSLSWLSWT